MCGSAASTQKGDNQSTGQYAVDVRDTDERSGAIIRCTLAFLREHGATERRAASLARSRDGERC
jgi:hypothetical protein